MSNNLAFNVRAQGPFFFMMDLIAISKKEKLVLRDLESSINDMGFDIIKIRFNEGTDPLLQIYVDNEIGAIDIEDCSMISKKASLLLDLEKTLDEDFRLEISSPGIDRPLTKEEHLDQVIGQEVFIKTNTKIKNKNKFIGKLIGYSKEKIIVEDKQGQQNFKFIDIIDLELRTNIYG